MSLNNDDLDKDQRNKEALQSAIESNEVDFEKKLTYISAGALALSLTFIEKIVKVESSTFIIFLILGWGLLVLSLSLNLCSFLISKKLVTKTQDEYYDFIEEKSKMSFDDILENQKKRNVMVAKINWSTLVLLLLGIAFITTFCAINISNKIQSDNNPKTKNNMCKTENASVSNSNTEKKGYSSGRLEDPNTSQQSNTTTNNDSKNKSK